MTPVRGAAAPPLRRLRTRSGWRTAAAAGGSERRHPRTGPRAGAAPAGGAARTAPPPQRAPLPQRAGPAARHPRPCLTLTWVSRPPSRKESGHRRRGGRRKEAGKEGERHRTASLRPGKAPPPPPAERGSPRRKRRGRPRCPGALRAGGGCGTVRS